MEAEKSLGKLRNGKVAGNFNILLEMLKTGRSNEDFVYMLTSLVGTVWEEKCVPQECVGVIIVPIPPKR